MTKGQQANANAQRAKEDWYTTALWSVHINVD